jgi:hypothetical protein
LPLKPQPHSGTQIPCLGGCPSFILNSCTALPFRAAGSAGRTTAVARSPTPQSSSHSRGSRGTSIDLNSQDGDFFLEGTPLLVAAGAVGRAMGVKIRPPARSEDLKRVKEPLEAIVRASRIRMRQVLLRDNWWEKDCGPLVAYTQQDNRPVALLPVSATRYEIFDPVERTRVPVDAHRASTLAPVAYMFYRSLPDKALKAVDIFRFALKGRGGLACHFIDWHCCHTTGDAHTSRYCDFD